MSERVLPLAKLVATGNDFIFIDAREPLAEAFAAVSRQELSRKLSSRHFGIGADGVVFVERDAEGLRWDFYNSDGSTAEMCGNATRCMGLWAQSFLGEKTVEFRTAAGRVFTTVSGEVVSSRLDFIHPKPRWIYSHNQRAALVNTGVPHVVVTGSIEKEKEDWKTIQAWRFHPEAGLTGANVTFLEIEAPNRFKTITFERGVEDFTLACGTGVLAAAAVGLIEERGGFEADVIAPGGQLHVKFGKDFHGAILSGPARFVFRTSVGEEILK